MKIIFINRFFYPDHSATSQMLSDLASALSARGHRVTVITSRLSYDYGNEKLKRHEKINGVDVTRVATTDFGRSNLAGRSVDYITFYITAAMALLRHADKGDVIVVKTDPPLLSIIAAPVAWLRGARLVNWLQDIFPEIAMALNVGKGVFAKTSFTVLRKLRDQTLKKASINVVLGDRMAEHLNQVGVANEKVRIIHNWVDGSLVRAIPTHNNPLRQTWQLNGSFVVGYSGNLGRAHEIEIMIRAIECLKKRNSINPNAMSEIAKDRRSETRPFDYPDHTNASNIHWLFIGGGAQTEKLKHQVSARHLSSVTFQNYQPRDQLANSLSVPDIHLVTLRPELEGLIVPSKYYGIAAAGRPAIFIGDPDGEIAQILKRSNTGVVIAPNDHEGLVRHILNYANDPELVISQGNRARQLFEAEFDFKIALSAWEQLLTEEWPPA
jgi:glycosyltransferase involved in cell wall biosynthesis